MTTDFIRTSQERDDQALDVFRRRQMVEEIGALMTEIKPNDLTIHELIGIVALLRSAAERLKASAAPTAQVLQLVPTFGQTCAEME